MGMVVIQPYILVSNLKKTKKKFLRYTGCLTAVKNILSSTVKRYMRDPVKI